MSYGIVQVQKFSSGSVKGVEIHDRREKQGVSHTNKDIDWSRTDQNYDLHPAQNTSFQKAVKHRIHQLNLPKAVRKDAVVMAQVLVTSDHEFFEWGCRPRKSRNFFLTAITSLQIGTGSKILFPQLSIWTSAPRICTLILSLSPRMDAYPPRIF